MKSKKIKVYIQKGYHVDTTQEGQFNIMWVRDDYDKCQIDPYVLALYKLPDTDKNNPGGYMVAVPAMMDAIPYQKAWCIVTKPRSKWHLAKLYMSFALRTVAWEFISAFMSKRVEREKLMRLGGLMDKEDTIFYKWSPIETEKRIRIFKQTEKSRNLFYEECDEVFH